MILPNGNSKKYIKTVIGIYILYVVVSPAISFAVGHDFRIDYSIYDKYFGASDEYKSLQSDFETENNKYIEKTYKDEIRKQISKTISELGYIATDINFDLNFDSGEIKNIEITVENKEEFTNTIIIEKIEIGNTIKEQTKNELSRQEIEKIKDLISSNLGINNNEIKINSI